jgi:hypothetical protein
MSPTTMKHTWSSYNMSGIFPRFQPNLNFFRRIVVKTSNIKYDGIRPVGPVLIRANRRTDVNDEVNRRFSRLRERGQNVLSVIFQTPVALVFAYCK